MPYVNSSVTVGGDYSHRKMFIEFQAFLTGITNIVFDGAGAPTLHGYGEINFAYCDAGVTEETITITCTDVTDINAPEFSVVGSVSGALTDAVGGVPYSNHNLNFTISLDWDNNLDTDTDTPYQLGDEFTFETVNSNLVQDDNAWELVRDLRAARVSTVFATNDYGITVRARGNAGTDNTFITFYTFTNDPSDFFTWRALAGRFENLWQEPFGISGQSGLTHLILWDGAMDYYFIANSRRVIVAAKTGSGVTMAGYYGLGLPYSLPEEYSYPVFVCGNATGNLQASSVDPVIGNYFDSDRFTGIINTQINTFLNVGNTNSSGSSRLRSSGLNGHIVEPLGIANSFINLCEVDPAGKYYLMNHIVVSYADEYGPMIMLDGSYYFNGVSPVISFDVVDYGGQDFLVVNNVFRTTKDQYAAIKLE